MHELERMPMHMLMMN